MKKDDCGWQPTKNVDNSYSAVDLINDSLGECLPSSEAPARYIDVPADELRGNEYNDVCGMSDIPFKTWEKEHLINGMGLVPGPSLGNSESVSGTINLPVSPAKRVGVARAVPGCKIPEKQQNTAIVDWSDTSLYPVSVTSNHLLNIPGVLEDCGLEDRVYERKVVCSKDPNHFSYTKTGRSCGNPGCPRHWVTWGRQAADRNGFRVDGFRKASRTRYPPRKIILSIDDEDPIIKTWRARGEPGAVRKARDYFIKKALKIGCKGGSMTIHLWRTNDKVPGYIQGQKRWDWVRLQGSRWREFVKYSPHAHIIGYGYLKRPDSDEFEYKNMGPLNTREEIEAVAYYNVSHAPVGPGITAVIYFGCCSYGKLRCVFKTQIHVDDYCPECGAVLIFEDTGNVAQRARTWGDFIIDPGGTT